MADLSYRASLKNPEVEEVVDLLIHRPLGYLVARAAYPTPVTADALTIASMLAGLASGAVFWSVWAGAASHHVLGGALLVLSAVLDCSDGQLARMRRASSRYGRMLDGAVDAVVQLAAVPAVVAHMVWRRGGLGTPGTAAWVVAAVAAVLLGVRHTTLYDQFKNVFVRNTDPHPRDCDDRDEIEAEWARVRAAGRVGALTWFRFFFYRMHLDLVAQTMRWIDPHIPARFADMPPHTPERAARYRALNARLMRAWSFYGVGTHIFALAACVMLDRLEWYIALRLVGFNAALVALVPLQRRASRAFFHGHGAQPARAAA
jgi:hypothetical protein